MASFLDLKVVHFVALLGSLILSYHVSSILVEGRVDMASMLTKQEELSIESQLSILNKHPIKTMHSSWGDTYDCIEFHKQPTFDHPLLKDHKFEMEEESADFVSTGSLKTLMKAAGECPNGTVPIRRTTREDLIRTKLTSNGLGDEYRAGVSYDTKQGETIYGASGWINVWNPSVHQDQFSAAEIVLQSGSQDQANIIKSGWMHCLYGSPQLYGDYVTRGFTYSEGYDGLQKTGCYNTLCHGFIQTHSTITPDMPFTEISKIGGDQIYVTSQIILDKPEGKWWLTLQDIRIGYWPKELFPAFSPGVASVFWGGRVKSGQDGSSPPMCSGQPINEHFADAGFINLLQYIDLNNEPRKPENIKSIIECSKHYNAEYYPKHNILHFGGSGGTECN
ncbi:hypothetical protein MKW94_003669 [Papaver nudicaule]|uniref:Neprosin PEP catalytic domain-containing protein n=1 Tax=Papaver nudicaule TaxID=74823 RepID=A0AA41S8E1_PAPNU|nr:hypothetical protein [Papaver nudicaule]